MALNNLALPRSPIPLDLAATAGQVAHNVAHVLLGGLDLDGHHRLKNDRIGLLERILDGHGTGDLERASEESTSW